MMVCCLEVARIHILCKGSIPVNIYEYLLKYMAGITPRVTDQIAYGSNSLGKESSARCLNI